MPIVTLTTDFGWRDYYLGLLKGAMLRNHASLNLVDITHDIQTYDIVQAAFIFRNIWKNFPKGTIHLVSVNDFGSPQSGFIAIQHHGHFFVGPDNGLFSLVFDQVPTLIQQLPYQEDGHFPLKEIYAEAIGHLANGKPIHELGEPKEELEQRITFQPVIGASRIRGSVIHIDNYENVILNITKDLFQQVGGERSFTLSFKRHDPITQLSNHYYEVPVGEILCLFNSADYLEIAINMGKASSLLGLQIEDTVQVDFNSRPKRK